MKKMINYMSIICLILCLAACSGTKDNNEGSEEEKEQTDEQKDRQVEVDTGEPIEKDDNDIKYGTFDNGIYKNVYFSIEIKMPEGWYAFDKEALEGLVSLGQEQVDEPEEEGKEDDAQMMPLFGFFSRESRGNQLANDNVIGSASYNEDGLTKEAYMATLLDEYHLLGVSFEEESLSTIDINGRAYVYKRIVMDAGIGKIWEEIYVFEERDWLITIIITSDSEENSLTLESMIQ